jgi:hypothetical protein
VCPLCATVHADNLCQKARLHRRNGWNVGFRHVLGECGASTGDWCPRFRWFEKCSALNAGQEMTWWRIAYQILPCWHWAMQRGGVSLIDNYWTIGIYLSLQCLVDDEMQFFYIKNLSWFIAPNGCLATKTFYCVAASFLLTFYECCFTFTPRCCCLVLVLAATLLWYVFFSTKLSPTFWYFSLNLEFWPWLGSLCDPLARRQELWFPD